MKIVFTNGCFDILHKGHASLLMECRSFGDMVVVGLNSDSSVRRLKGHGRPVNDERSRRAALLRLSWVDHVFVFEEDSPLRLIMKLKPAVIVKGGDYKIEEVVGYKECVEWGGSVHLARFIDGQSTTRILHERS